MRNPLTAASLGLHIGLLLCLTGCGTDAAPEQADEQCVEDTTPLPVPEKSVAVPMATKAEVDAVRDIANQSLEIDMRMAKLLDRIIKLLEKQAESNQCCTMPAAAKPVPEVNPAQYPILFEGQPASPIKPEVVRSSPKKSESAKPTNIIDGAEQRSRDDGQKLVIVLTKDGCSRCAAFMSGVIGNSFFRAIDGNLHFQEINISRNPSAVGRFDIPGGTLMPVALIWNPATETFHQIPCDPAQSTGDFLSELDLPQDAAPPRKRLRNLLP